MAENDQNNCRESARRLKRAWWDVALYGVPSASVAVLIARYSFDLQVQITDQSARHGVEYWLITSAGMIVGFVVAKLVGDKLLRPDALARKALEDREPKNGTKIDFAETQIRVGLILQLGILDLPAVLLLFHSILLGSQISAGLAIFHCLISFVALQPDTERLVKDTVQVMEAPVNAGSA